MSDVWVAVDLEGWHSWPDAPAHRDYLAARHRHLFRVTATVTVTHEDRAVEFHDLRDEIVDWWPTGGEFDDRSCETIARQLAEWLGRTLPDALRLTVDVSEDGEAGATVTIDVD